ncbi:MAG: DUF4411 family protein [Candidatus Acidiferrales bacterium]
MPYSLDTGGILDARVRHYPPDVFPALWLLMSESSKKRESFVIEEVVAELERKDDDVHKWVKQREAMIVAIEGDIQTCLVKLMSKYARLVDSKRNRSGGDPRL